MRKMELLLSTVLKKWNENVSSLLVNDSKKPQGGKSDEFLVTTKDEMMILLMLLPNLCVY